MTSISRSTRSWRRINRKCSMRGRARFGNRARASRRESPASMPLRAQYVGTRGYDLTYRMPVNGYQSVCEGCFAPYPYLKPPDPRFGDVTQFMSNATSQYNGLQLTLQRRPSAGLSWI